MKIFNLKPTTNNARSNESRISAGQWAVVIFLFSLLAVTIFQVFLSSTPGSNTSLTASEYAVLAFGVVGSIALGFALMALVFYSSRKGYDIPPVLLVPRQEEQNDDRQSSIYEKPQPEKT